MAPEPLRVPRHYLKTRAPSPPPVISIVTPSFQQGRFLERTIRSVVEQGYPALQYVVMDGGSTDGTLDVIRRWEPRLHAWDSAPDGGQADAINRGFDRTDGEIMAYLNSDDVLLPGALAYVARQFRSRPELDALYGHRLTIDEQDRRVDIGPVAAHDDDALRWSMIVPQETLFWRRSIWERSGGTMDDSLRFALDWDLLLRFLDAGAHIARVDRYLGAFRRHGDQKSATLTHVGDEEVARLRRRVHGPAASAGPPRSARAHHRRDVLVRRAHRLRAFLPARRVVPPWLS